MSTNRIPGYPTCGTDNTHPDYPRVTLIKGSRVQGSPLAFKGGRKIKNIHLTDGGHDIDRKVDDQSMLLKSEIDKAGLIGL